MSNHIPKLKFLILLLVSLAGAITFFTFAGAQTDDAGQAIQPIMMTEPKESLDDRMARKITLDVRDMNIVDVIKFLAQKGEFNVIIAPSVEGRSTVLLHDVGIKDALDIVVISNKLAYHIDDDIVQVMSAAEYEAMYGKQFSDKTEVSIVHLQYAKPSYVLAALDNMRSNRGKIIIDEDTGSVVLVDTPQSIALMKKAIEQIEQPLETIVFNLKYAKADVVAEKLRTRIDAKAVGTITADERSNQILVRVFPGRRDEVEKTIHSLDLPTKEVLIDARVLQIVVKPTFDLGVDLSGPITSSGKQQFNLSNTTVGTPASGDNLASHFGEVMVGNMSANQFTANLRAQQQVSDTKILSNPQILVTNNEEAKIHIGDTVPYIVSTTNGTGTNAITSDDVRFVDVGLKLSVIPTINDDGMVTMKLTPEISDVIATVTSCDNILANGQCVGSSIPEVNKTEVETSVMVKDGQTIIMAGLRDQNKVHQKNGIPGLMDLPWIGGAFSRTSDVMTNTEIVILITPHIVKGTDDFDKSVGTIKAAKTYNETVPK